MSKTNKDGVQSVFASALSYGTVTKSDATVLDFNGVYVGGAGDVALKPDADSSAVTFPSVPTGTILPISGIRVMSTNTTATNMVWLKW